MNDAVPGLLPIPPHPPTVVVSNATKTPQRPGARLLGRRSRSKHFTVPVGRTFHSEVERGEYLLWSCPSREFESRVFPHQTEHQAFEQRAHYLAVILSPQRESTKQLGTNNLAVQWKRERNI